MYTRKKVSGVNTAKEEVTNARKGIGNGGRFSKRHSGRPLPKRGQVKVGIVVGIAHSFASIFSPRSWQKPWQVGEEP
ncbi:unnamed protein product, partial [Vitis vinifera]